MVKLRRDILWRWSCQWTVVALAAVALVLYNAMANVRILGELKCANTRQIGSTCEPCPKTPSSMLISVDDDPLSRLDLRLGRWDASRSYRLYDYAAVGDRYADVSGVNRVCLATQASIERLTELLSIGAHWSGSISVSVFAAGDEFKQLRGFTTWLFHCEPELYARLALHVVIPAGRPGVSGQQPQWARECSNPPSLEAGRSSDTAQWRAHHPYPQNHLRNLARKNCQTPYVFLVDIDIVPSKGMTEALNDFFASPRKCTRCAYVVPTYELYRPVANFPSSKSELLQLSRLKLAMPFHRKVSFYSQKASNFSRWEARVGRESLKTHVSHKVTKFNFLYEPFYVAPDTVPPHDERFVGYGYTRNSQVYEMHLKGYQFWVLSPIFTIHWGLQLHRIRPSWREWQNQRNSKHFQGFKRELLVRYQKDPHPENLLCKKLVQR